MGKNILVSVASIFSLVQSLIWLSLATCAALVYRCIIEVPPYTRSTDFFRVTFVKLYFEGPQCIPNGTYLGKFNDDYRNHEKINLLTPDVIFAIMVAKIILNFAQLILSLLFYQTNKSENHSKMVDIALSWSILLLIISSLDAFLTIELGFDIFNLIEYLNVNKEYIMLNVPDLGGMQCIPLIFGLISSRLVVLWLWNVIIASCFLINGLCFKKVFGEKNKKESGLSNLQLKSNSVEKPSSNKVIRRFSTSSQLPNHKSRSDWNIYALEAVTKFNDDPKKPLKTFPQRHTMAAMDEYAWNSYTYDYEKERDVAEECEEEEEEEEEAKETVDTKRKSNHWESTNEGFVRDDSSSCTSEKDLNFEQKLKRFESGAWDIKIVKLPIGKPVSVPVPPPLPRNGSFSC